MDKKTMRSRFVGGMVGSALGDAIGELAFRNRDRKKLLKVVEEEPLLRYTDDMAMAIGIAEVICEKGDVTPGAVGGRFKENYEKEPWRGYGPGPPRVFSLVDKGHTFEEAAGMLFGGEGSFGNGAAMRITPVGLFFHDSGSLVEKVRITAKVTHAHPLGQDGAVVLAGAIAEAVGQDPDEPFRLKDFCDKLASVTVTSEFIRKIFKVYDLSIDAEVQLSQAAEILGTDVTALGSVPFSIFCFLRNRGSFKECLLDAVLAGGDRDTIGAMACAVSGAYLGEKDLPAKWTDKLENFSYIKDLAIKMADLERGAG
ncbi:MAG: ADP-ribosylglycohydrolase family protein [Candidatus Omnitrophota bacterium]|nr:ADP-ribosylglycohydrolase family protein [Candidatus Omnitrophota bacterium]